MDPKISNFVKTTEGSHDIRPREDQIGQTVLDLVIISVGHWDIRP